LGDIYWLRNQGLLDVLGLSSTVYAEFLRRRGVDSIVIPRGWHPSYGKKLNSERDIAAVWMGKLRTRRRKNIVHRLHDELTERGLDMRIFDGGANGFLFGAERTKLLNRTRFVLNVNFSGPTDELSIRYFVSGANGAVVLTEPNANEYAFRDGEHIVISNADDMAGRIQYYVDHPAEWQAISSGVHRLVTEELTLARSLETLMARAESVRSARLAASVFS
jgi:hypothetical protein